MLSSYGKYCKLLLLSYVGVSWRRSDASVWRQGGREGTPSPAIFSKSSRRNSVHSASRHLFLYVTEEFNTNSSRHLKVARQSGGQNPTTEGPCLLRTQRQPTTMSARKDIATACTCIIDSSNGLGLGSYLRSIFVHDLVARR